VATIAALRERLFATITSEAIIRIGERGGMMDVAIGLGASWLAINAAFAASRVWIGVKYPERVHLFDATS
jgi:hypothetical protein